VLSNGRLDFGVGRGQVVYEYNNFKVEYDSRTQRFQEIVDIILGCGVHRDLLTTANTTAWTT
jgi:alkanesulfonate monooxygenase SsuD/methylene tetrahydromethanopterin reductase-like flavin-dependent oxidoreductase (luciferase family)